MFDLARDERGQGDGEALRPHRNALKSPQPAVLGD
jgi:hypothetical protein